MEKLEDFLATESRAELSSVIRAIALTSLDVWRTIPLATGVEKGFNPSGDRQTKVDVYANDLFLSSLLNTGVVAEVASEELESPRRGRGALHVSMDPLDGSSNIATNNPLGSIFGVYSSALPADGHDLRAAAFVTYGPMLTLTFSLGKAVQRFVSVEVGGKREFMLQEEKIVLPEEGEVYGFGGLRKDWIAPVEKFVYSLEQRGMKLRYGGTFVGDYNQVLRHGGIFGYPALKGRPRGKLRILYETAPIAFITSQAGGAASDGTEDILSLKPKDLADTSPVYVGNKALVEEIERRIKSD